MKAGSRGTAARVADAEERTWIMPKLRYALLALLLAMPAAAQAPGFIEVIPTERGQAVRIAAAQVVRVGRGEGGTVIDTTAWVQQRSAENVEAVARKLQAAGQRLVALTDLSGGRTYIAADRVVLVRDSGERHAAGARAAIVMVGLRFNTDVAVRESVGEVMDALARLGPLSAGGG
jgi:hypothetical protein